MASKLPPGAKSEKTKTGPPPPERWGGEDGPGPNRPYRGRVKIVEAIPGVAGYDFPPTVGSWEDELPPEGKMPKGKKLSNGSRR